MMTRNSELLGENPVTVPLCSFQELSFSQPEDITKSDTDVDQMQDRMEKTE